MTKFHILSDLHLEFPGNTRRVESLIQEADVALIAGDLDVGIQKVSQWLSFFAKRYKQVVYVLGNHELYDKLTLKSFNHKDFGIHLPNNVHFLNPGTVILDHVTIIGAPLWTNFRDNPMLMKYAKSFINDFRRGLITPQDYLEQYNYELKYIRGIHKQTEGKRIILTHFMPAKELIAPHWANHPDEVTRALNGYFANNLADYIKTLENTTWVFGHTHDSVDSMIGTTRCIANPLGYPGEKNYQPLIIEL